MTILEKREKVINLKNELQTILSNGEAENRELAENENGRIAEIRGEIDTLENEIQAEEAENREINNENKNHKKMAKFNLFDTVKAVAEGNVTDEMRSYVNGNKIMLRGVIQAQGEDGTGKENVPTDEKSLELAIRNASVLSNLNATVFSNAVGDIQIPRYSGSQCGWKGEIETADDGAGEFDEVVLQPKRLTAYIDISKTFLAQDRNSAEALLIRDLSEACAEKLDETIFGSESGTTTRPEGLFYGVEASKSINDISYDDVLDLELGVEEANGKNYVFVASPKVKFALKGTQMASGLGMVYSAGEIDGYKAVVSNSVKNGGLIAFDARDLAVAFWNGLGEITVDPYTKATDNQIRIVLNFYVDAKLKGDRIAKAVFSD